MTRTLCCSGAWRAVLRSRRTRWSHGSSVTLFTSCCATDTAASVSRLKSCALHAKCRTPLAPICCGFVVQLAPDRKPTASPHQVHSKFYATVSKSHSLLYSKSTGNRSNGVWHYGSSSTCFDLLWICCTATSPQVVRHRSTSNLPDNVTSAKSLSTFH